MLNCCCFFKKKKIFVAVQGVIDLFRLPYEQYQRDGRIVRGIQLGAQSFTSRTALAALELTTRLIYLLQVISQSIYLCFFFFVVRLILSNSDMLIGMFCL